jgi:RND superfamily putative drug exporter
MVCVFGSFVVADFRAIKLIGLGLAVAVLIDATLVRMVLVPATMELLGRTNWWLPRWLDRVMPRFVVEHRPAPVRPRPLAVGAAVGPVADEAAEPGDESGRSLPPPVGVGR